MKRIIIVAHPDDEILFFSSLLNTVDKIVVCFGPSKNQTLSKGREKLKSQYPLSSVQWLNIHQSDTYLSPYDWHAQGSRADVDLRNVNQRALAPHHFFHEQS